MTKTQIGSYEHNAFKQKVCLQNAAHKLTNVSTVSGLAKAFPNPMMGKTYLKVPSIGYLLGDSCLVYHSLPELKDSNWL